MGAALGSCVGSCVGSATMAACCAACGCQCLASPGLTNLLYVFLVVVSAMAGVLMRYGGIDLNVGFDIGISGPSICVGNSTACESAAISYSICNGDNCQGYWAVYRITFTLSGVFLLLALATACHCECSTRLHRGYWFFKFATFACVLAGTIFASNDLFAYYAWFARFIAPLFLLYQLIIFIDFGYSINEWLIGKDEAEDQCCWCIENNGFKYHIVILLVAFCNYALAFTAICVMYSMFEMACPFNPLAITTTLLFGLMNTAVSVSKVAEHGSILCSSVIFVYQAWLCYAALAALPEFECNPNINLEEGSDQHAVQLTVSIAVAGLSCGYFAYRQGSKSIGGNAMVGGASKAPAIEMTDFGGAAVPPATSNDAVTVHVRDDNSNNSSTMEAVEPAGYGGYYLRMFIISMYMAMLLTDWGVAAHTTQSAVGVPYSVGYASAWLQLGTNWLCGLLYLWTLVAPKLFPDRDFT